jgi:8-hydroxy-5-deazaflavin:NADPH oxidoreductase
MKIAVIGSGLMGSALGKAWAQREHQIFFTYSRDSSKLVMERRLLLRRMQSPRQM